MPCNHPLKAFDTGLLTENGKPLYFIAKGAVDMVPVEHVYKRFGSMPSKGVFHNGQRFLIESIDIPCGSCSGCRMDHARDWKIRCCIEAAAYDHNSFITLTYDNDHLPSDGELSKRDLQLFFKRLRRSGVSFRYFACGEYGEITKRPHYHAILFGLNFDDCHFWQLVGGNPYFVSDSLSAAWPNGRALVGHVDSGSISYVCGYVEKKQVDCDFYQHEQKPFVLMSRRPGIGSWYYDANCDRMSVHPYCYGSFGSSHRSKLARYYLSRLEKDFPEEYAILKSRRVERGFVARDIQSVLYPHMTREEIGFCKDVTDVESIKRRNKL